MIDKPKILVFATGTDKDGGSGFKNLVEASQDGRLDAEIVGVVSNYSKGGVWAKAKKLKIPFYFFGKPQTAAGYHYWAKKSGADFFALSGWLKKVKGLNFSTRFNPRTVFNIHPGPLPRFGGDGMWGHHVHEAVMKAFRAREITHSAVSIHYVTRKYDEGPVVLNFQVKINEKDTPKTVGKRVNIWEHVFQPMITNMIVHGEISWDGKNRASLRYPETHCIDQFDEK